jgi:carbonic anhydrase/acetyltransferase-like protein (isoleucine patch superfamily)
VSKVDFEGKKPRVDESVFLAPGSWVIGDVTIMEGANVWNGAIIRGDDDTVEIGARATILENCVVEAPTGSPVKIGDGAIVSHGAIVHGATVHPCPRHPGEAPQGGQGRREGGCRHGARASPLEGREI